MNESITHQQIKYINTTLQSWNGQQDRTVNSNSPNELELKIRPLGSIIDFLSNEIKSIFT